MIALASLMQCIIFLLAHIWLIYPLGDVYKEPELETQVDQAQEGNLEPEPEQGKPRYPYPSTSNRCFVGRSSIVSIPLPLAAPSTDAPPPYSNHPPPPYRYPPYPYPPPPAAGFTGAHAPPTYSYPPPPAYPYPPPQPIHSGGDEHSSGGQNTFQTTQTPARTEKRNEWTREDEENLFVLKFILSLSFF
jgi:hypothetical protein